MNMPNFASRHQAIRASRCAGVSGASVAFPLVSTVTPSLAGSARKPDDARSNAVAALIAILLIIECMIFFAFYFV
jgi:hypothetical protein